MSDIRCVVCGEPWNAYGVSHGDMCTWEAKLFRLGAGCPSCEGTPNGWEPKSIFDVENGDEDPISRIMASERVANGTKVEWKRPEDPVLWTCDDCGHSVKRDLDSEEIYMTGHTYSRYEPDEEPEHTFHSGRKVCADCYETCTNCSEPIEPGTESFYTQEHDVKLCCEDCLCEWQHEEAQRVWAKCYSEKERIEYIRKNRNQFEFHSIADIIGCVRGKYFLGYESELIG